MQDNTAYDVFLSYSHDDEDELNHASLIAETLQARGYSVWWDRQLVVGEDWHDKLTQKMMLARKIIGLVSNHMLESEYCRYELHYALMAGKLLPVLMEPADELVFPEDLDEGIRKLNWVNHGNAPTDETLESVIRGLDLAPEAKDALRPSAQIFAKTRIHLPATLMEGAGYLAGRETEEKMLLDAWDGCSPDADAQNKTNIVVMHALGGAGKTSILRRMVDQLAGAEFPNATKVLGWSAINQGGTNDLAADTDSFFSDALRTFGIVSDLPNDPVARARLLAKTMRAHRTLLLLDGIEPLQEIPGVGGGRLKDPGLKYLLVELARGHPGLVVVTTRQALPELAGHTQPAVITHPLEDLSNEASVDLLKYLGNRGTPEAFRAAAELVAGHALSVTLMGTYLNVVEGGDISRYLSFDIAKVADQEDDEVFDAKTERLASRADDIIKCYIHRFEALQQHSASKGEAENLLLRLVGLFTRPADGPAIDMLLSGDPIPGLTDAYSTWTRGEQAARLRVGKRRLQDLKLLAPANPADRRGIDAHPIVRAYFARQMRETRPDAYREAQTRLFQHYSKAAPDQPDTLEEMEPLLLAVQHGCRAGLHPTVFETIYRTRIQRGNKAFLKTVLGAYSADLGALSNFFERPWSDTTPEITDPEQKAQIFGQAALSLRITGRLADAEDTTRAAMVLERSVGKRGDVAILQNNLAELELLVGNARDAEANARQAALEAEDCFETDAAVNARSVLAESLHMQGQFDGAANEFLEAEAAQRLAYPDIPYLVSHPGLRWTRCLLDLGFAEDAQARARYLAGHAEGRSLFDQQAIALASLVSTNASLSEQGRSSENLKQEASQALETALSILRVGECEEFLPLGALASSRAWRAFAASNGGDWPWKVEDVREELAVARQIADRLGLPLRILDLEIESMALDAVVGGAVRPPRLSLADDPFTSRSLSDTSPKPKAGLLYRLMGRTPKNDAATAISSSALHPEWSAAATESGGDKLGLVADLSARLARISDDADGLHYHLVRPQLEAWSAALAAP